MHATFTQPKMTEEVMWGENEFGDYILELKEDSKTFFRIEKF